MIFSLELFRTMDGLRLGELPLVPASWTVSLRDSNMDGPPTDAGYTDIRSMYFSVAAMETYGWINTSEPGWQARLWSTLMPKKHGIMLLADGTPIAGGPIAGDVSIDAEGVSLSIDSWDDAVLSSRYVVPEDYAADRQIRWSGIPLGTIVKKILQYVSSKPNGELPFTYQADGIGSNERTYQSFNVPNLDAASRVQNITNVINGPDVTYRPYIKDDQHFAWYVITGTNTDPYIGQDVVHDWEYGTEDVHQVSADLSADYIAHRVYAVGDGQDVGTHVAKVEVEVPPEWPLIEKVVSDSDITAESDHDKKRLIALGQGSLLQFPIIQIRMTVNGDGTNPLGSFWPGEIAHVTIQGHPAMLDGTYDMRILEISGSTDNPFVDLVFDPLILEQY